MKFNYQDKNFDIQGTSDQDHIHRKIVRHNTFYEIDLLKYAAGLTDKNSGNVIVDVGANIGNHSIFFQSFMAEYVISVEPNPDVTPVLEKNLKNNISNYFIYKYGLGETSGTGKIHIPEDSTDNVGMAKLDMGEGDIEIITLDELLHKWRTETGLDGAVSLIKIDVEGMEMSVLKGAVETIDKYHPHIFAEAATDREFFLLKDYLSAFDYYPVVRYSSTPVYHFAYKPSFADILKARVGRLVSRLKKNIRRAFRGKKRH